MSFITKVLIIINKKKDSEKTQGLFKKGGVNGNKTKQKYGLFALPYFYYKLFIQLVQYLIPFLFQL